MFVIWFAVHFCCPLCLLDLYRSISQSPLQKKDMEGDTGTYYEGNRFFETVGCAGDNLEDLDTMGVLKQRRRFLMTKVPLSTLMLSRTVKAGIDAKEKTDIITAIVAIVIILHATQLA